MIDSHKNETKTIKSMKYQISITVEAPNTAVAAWAAKRVETTLQRCRTHLVEVVQVSAQAEIADVAELVVGQPEVTVVPTSEASLVKAPVGWTHVSADEPLSTALVQPFKNYGKTTVAPGAFGEVE